MERASAAMSGTREQMEKVLQSSLATEDELSLANGQIETLSIEIDKVRDAVHHQTCETETIVSTIYEAGHEAGATLQIAKQLGQLSQDLMQAVEAVQGETSKFKTNH
jgi:SMC interacting uncharacterized protein involved in chromosome segregation